MTVRDMELILPDPHAGGRVPLVSVIMSVYNGERFLREAIESILSQTLGDLEFIIVNDGSTDATEEILAAYAAADVRIEIIRNEVNIGLTKSLNKGLKVASGRYLARQDADDVSMPHRLHKQVSYLELHDETVIVGSACQLIDVDGNIVSTRSYPANDTSIRWQMLFDNAFAHSTVMVRRDILHANALLYDERQRFAQDYELWSRLLTFGTGANFLEPLIWYRLHAQSIGGTFTSEQEDVAIDVAQANITKLGLDVSHENIKIIRMWKTSGNVAIEYDYKCVYYVLNAIMSKFEQLYPKQKSQLVVARRRWLYRFISKFPYYRIYEVKYFTLMIRLFIVDTVKYLYMICLSEHDNV